MPSRGGSREKPNPRKNNTQGWSYSAPEQQHFETDLSSDGPPPPQGAANHPHRAWRVCDTDSSNTGKGPFLSTEQIRRAVRTQGFPPSESGISPDGFPSRSVEEGGVSGLFSQRENDQVSNSPMSSGNPSSSSSGSRSADSSASDVYGASIHTARAVPILRLRLGQQHDERPNMNRLPSPAALDRIDDGIEDAVRKWTDGPRRAARQTQKSKQQEDGRLTGGSDMSINPRNLRAPDSREVGHRGLQPSSRPHHTRRNVPHYTNRAGEYRPAGGQHTQPSRVSSTPSESSIAETVSNRRPRTPSPRTPPRPQLDRALLPSRRQQTTATAGSSHGLTRGPYYPDPVAAQEELENVPPVLVPGGLFGLGGSHPRLPPQVLRRQGQGDSGEDKKGKGREQRKKER